MESTKLQTGSAITDSFLEGGYDCDIINTIYGPSGSGKTCFCLLASISAVRNNKKVIFIDTEGGFSIARFKQLAPDFEKLLDSIILLKPTTFSKQKEDFRNLKDIVNSKIGLIIVDTISSLYRVEMNKENVYEVNTELIQQLSYLTEIARARNIPIIVTNQVYDSFDKPGQVSMVGGNILKNSSKAIIELKKARQDTRAAIIRKHRSIAEKKEILFRIVEKGLEKAESVVL